MDLTCSVSISCLYTVITHANITPTAMPITPQSTHSGHGHHTSPNGYPGPVKSHSGSKKTQYELDAEAEAKRRKVQVSVTFRYEGMHPHREARDVEPKRIRR